MSESPIKLKKPIGVLFVCMGNICRSPCAEGLFRDKLQQRGLQSLAFHDSAGTDRYADSHHTPDPRSIQVCSQHGVDIGGLRSRTVVVEDFYSYDYLLAMDNANLHYLRALAPPDSQAVLELILRIEPVHYLAGELHYEVPDPYYGGVQGFDQMYELLDHATDALLEHLLRR